VTVSHGSRLAPDERRDQLISMGVQLLGARAYDQMSITELAQAAGISKGLLYHYFPTKTDFVVAVLRRSRDELEARMVFDPALEPAARLDAALDTFLGFVEEHAAGFLALTRAREGQDEAIVAELAEGRRRRVSRLIDGAAALAGVERSELESPALESVLAGWLAFGEEIIVRWLAEHELSRDQVRHLLRQALLGGLVSVAGVDGTPAAARLAEAAERAAHAPVASVTRGGDADGFPGGSGAERPLTGGETVGVVRRASPQAPKYRPPAR
jgi:AcrR family transcriptional regulator